MMNQDMFNLNNKIYSNYNNLLLDIINELQQINTITKDNLVIKRIGDIIIKMNFIINENKKNTDLIINHISLLQNQLNYMNNNFAELKINNQINNKEIKYDNGDRYNGQVVNGLKEGRGILYYNNGDRYEGEWRNDKKDGKGTYFYSLGERYEGDFRNGKKEGKGIAYFNNGNRYDGNWRNNKFEGKGVYYFHSGNRYEGDWKNGKREGKGVYYFNNGDRKMGDFANDKEIGKQVMLTKKGAVKTLKY